MGHWRRNHDSKSNLLRHHDLFDERNSTDGKDVYLSPVVVIERMSVEKLQSKENPKGERRNVAHFRGKAKPLGLNVTNCETLESLSGSPDPQRWVGLTVKLVVDKNAKYPGGKRGPAIRIAPTKPTGPSDTSPLPEVPADVRERLEAEQEANLEGKV